MELQAMWRKEVDVMPPWLEYHKEPVTLHSGDRSHWLVRGDLIFADEELREAVLRRWKARLSFNASYREFVGIGSGGANWAEAIAEKMRGHWRSLSPDLLADLGPLLRPDRDGQEGAPAHPLVVVDDVATTGQSIGLVPHANDRLVVVDRRRELQHPADTLISWARIPLPLLPEERA